MRNTKSAFTLVELIVVITILAILGTIAFISLQGYSADARNSKRTSDLSSIASSLNIKLTTGMGILSSIVDSSSALTSVSLGGRTGITSASGTYNAGKINYDALGMKASEFQDPDGNDYAGGVTTLAGEAYQLAASVESNSTRVAKIVGNYNPRNTSTSVVTVSGQLVTLTNEIDAFRFKVGDMLDDGVTPTLEVSKVSSDGLNLTIKDGVVPAPASVGVELVAAESAGLIGIKGNLANPVIDGSGGTLPY